MNGAEGAIYAYFASLKYAPGLYKEFTLLGGNLEGRGQRVRYLLSSGYRWMWQSRPIDAVEVTHSLDGKSMAIDSAKLLAGGRQLFRKVFAGATPKFICFYNPHPLNAAVLRWSRQMAPSSIRTLYLHEPWRPDRSAYTWREKPYYMVVEVCQDLALRETTDVILPSPYAVDLFRRRFPGYQGRTHYAPILLEDEALAEPTERRYFSMIGRVTPTKGLEEFVEFVNVAADRSDGLQFQLVTASPVDGYLESLSPQGAARLRLVNKARISDEEICEAIARSYAVLFLDRAITQSGVMPIAFMNGTPAIVRDLPGLTQFVQHGVNGCVVPKGFTSDDLFEAAAFVRDRFQALSLEARETYERVFDARNWPRYYGWLMDALAGGKGTSEGGVRMGQVRT